MGKSARLRFILFWGCFSLFQGLFFLFWGCFLLFRSCFSLFRSCFFYSEAVFLYSGAVFLYSGAFFFILGLFFFILGLSFLFWGCFFLFWNVPDAQKPKTRHFYIRLVRKNAARTNEKTSFFLPFFFRKPSQSFKDGLKALRQLRRTPESLSEL